METDREVDAQYLAAIAASRCFLVATRDTTPFEAAGLKVIYPGSFEVPDSARVVSAA